MAFDDWIKHRMMAAGAPTPAPVSVNPGGVPNGSILQQLFHSGVSPNTIAAVMSAGANAGAHAGPGGQPAPVSQVNPAPQTVQPAPMNFPQVLANAGGQAADYNADFNQNYIASHTPASPPIPGVLPGMPGLQPGGPQLSAPNPMVNDPVLKQLIDDGYAPAEILAAVPLVPQSPEVQQMGLNPDDPGQRYHIFTSVMNRSRQEQQGGDQLTTPALPTEGAKSPTEQIASAAGEAAHVGGEALGSAASGFLDNVIQGTEVSGRPMGPGGAGTGTSLATSMYENAPEVAMAGMASGLNALGEVKHVPILGPAAAKYVSTVFQGPSQYVMGNVGDGIYDVATGGDGSKWYGYGRAVQWVGDKTGQTQGLDEWTRNPANKAAIIEAHDVGLKDSEGNVIAKGGLAVMLLYMQANHPADMNMGSFASYILNMAAYDPWTAAMGAGAAGKLLESAGVAARTEELLTGGEAAQEATKTKAFGIGGKVLQLPNEAPLKVPALAVKGALKVGGAVANEIPYANTVLGAIGDTASKLATKVVTAIEKPTDTAAAELEFEHVRDSMSSVARADKPAPTSLIDTPEGMPMRPEDVNPPDVPTPGDITDLREPGTDGGRVKPGGTKGARTVTVDNKVQITYDANQKGWVLKVKEGRTWVPASNETDAPYPAISGLQDAIDSAKEYSTTGGITAFDAPQSPITTPAAAATGVETTPLGTVEGRVGDQYRIVKGTDGLYRIIDNTDQPVSKQTFGSAQDATNAAESIVPDAGVTPPVTQDTTPPLPNQEPGTEPIPPVDGEPIPPDLTQPDVTPPASSVADVFHQKVEAALPGSNQLQRTKAAMQFTTRDDIAAYVEEQAKKNLLGARDDSLKADGTGYDFKNKPRTARGWESLDNFQIGMEKMWDEAAAETGTGPGPLDNAPPPPLSEFDALKKKNQEYHAARDTQDTADPRLAAYNQLSDEEKMAVEAHHKSNAMGETKLSQLHRDPNSIIQGESVSTSKGKIDVRKADQLLTGAIERNQLSEDTTLYRTIRPKDSAELDALKPGDSFTQSGYMSTTRDPAIAEEWANAGRRAMRTPYIVEVRAPAGTRGLDIPNPRSAAPEEEVLLGANTKWRVVSVDRSPNQTPRVVIEPVESPVKRVITEERRSQLAQDATNVLRPDVTPEAPTPARFLDQIEQLRTSPNKADQTKYMEFKKQNTNNQLKTEKAHQVVEGQIKAEQKRMGDLITQRDAERARASAATNSRTRDAAQRKAKALSAQIDATDPRIEGSIQNRKMMDQKLIGVRTVVDAAEDYKDAIGPPPPIRVIAEKTDVTRPPYETESLVDLVGRRTPAGNRVKYTPETGTYKISGSKGDVALIKKTETGDYVAKVRKETVATGSEHDVIMAVDEKLSPGHLSYTTEKLSHVIEMAVYDGSEGAMRVLKDRLTPEQLNVVKGLRERVTKIEFNKDGSVFRPTIPHTPQPVPEPTPIPESVPTAGSAPPPDLQAAARPDPLADVSSLEAVGNPFTPKQPEGPPVPTPEPLIGPQRAEGTLPPEDMTPPTDGLPEQLQRPSVMGETTTPEGKPKRGFRANNVRAMSQDPLANMTPEDAAIYSSLGDSTKHMVDNASLTMEEAKYASFPIQLTGEPITTAHELYDSYRLLGNEPETALNLTLKAVHDTIVEGLPEVSRTKFSKALRAWDNGQAAIREGIQYNFITGGRGALQDTVYDLAMSVFTGHGKAYILTPDDLKLVARAVHESNPELLNEMSAFSPLREAGLVVPHNYFNMNRDLTIGEIMGRTDTNVVADQMAFERFLTEKGIIKDPTVAKVITRPFAVKFFKTMRNTLDMTKRAAMYQDEFNKNLPDAQKAMYRFLNDRASQLGEDGGDWQAAILKRAEETATKADQKWSGNFSPDDVLSITKDESSARAWRRELNIIDKQARKETDRVLLSYRRNRIDQGLSHAVFFHYWGTRNLILHADIALHNPFLVSNYIRGWDRLKEDAKAMGAPNTLMAYFHLMGNTTHGLYSLIDPISFVVPTQMFMDLGNPNDPIYKQLGLFLTPWTEGALAVFGLTDSVPNLLGTASIERAVQRTMDYMHSQGIGTEHFTGDYVRDLEKGFLTAGNLAYKKILALGGREGKTYDPYNPESTQVVQVKSQIHYLAERQYGPQFDQNGILLWSPETQALVADADTRAGLGGGAMEDNTLSKQAYENFAGMGMTSLVFGLAIPNTMRSAQLDHYRMLANDGYAATDLGQTPTAEQKNAMMVMTLINAGSAVSYDLTNQMNQVNSAGTDKGREVYNMWSEVAYGSDPASILGGSVTNDQVLGLDTSTRQDLADLWLATQPLATQKLFDAQRSARDVAISNSPDDQAYRSWAKNARSADSIKAFRDDLMRGNPNYAAYIANYDTYVSKFSGTTPPTLDEYSISRDAYKAAMGAKDTVYSGTPKSTNSGAYMGMSTGAGASNAAKTPKDQLISDMLGYNAKLALFNRTLQAFTGNPNATLDGMNPMLQNAVLWKLNQAGISPPSMPSSVADYMKWAQAQQGQNKTSDISTYLQWRADTLKAFATSGLSDQTVIDYLLGGNTDPYAGTNLGIPLPSGSTPSYQSVIAQAQQK